ncbi:PaaI family thioesterase [Novosphingobium tardum]|uniref:PaaI family thioesterase n=1 Tax=Novosphingobium tardum TaxID=1538021 RepID=A0ABV8RMQ5_9SPHN
MNVPGKQLHKPTDTVPIGLGRVRRMVAEGMAAIPIGETLGFALVEAEEGRTVLEGEPTRGAYNVLNSVHGGYVATLLDSACGTAVHSTLTAGLSFTTLELKISYLRALTDESGVLRATGRVLMRGRRVSFAEAELHDGAGRLCATATSTLLIIDTVARKPDSKGLT